jgi:hypothetical protein
MLLHSATHKNIGLAILSPGLPPRATADPDSRKQLVEADAIRAQQQALIEERRNQQSARLGPPGLPATPGTVKTARLPKNLSSSIRSTKRARAPPNITIDGSAGKSVPDLSIQSAPLYPPRGSLYTHKPNGDSGPMTSSLYHKDSSSSFPYSIPHRRGPSDPSSMHGHNSDHRTRPSPPQLPSITAQLSQLPLHPPPTPQTPSMKKPTELAKRWLEGKSIRPRRRAKSDQDFSSSEDSDTPVTIHLAEKVTMTKMEWLQRGHDLLERAWHDMVTNEKSRQKMDIDGVAPRQQPSSAQEHLQRAQNGPTS